MRSPAFTSSGTDEPFARTLPFPTATTSPSIGFSLALSGMMIPPLVFSSSARRFTMIRSCKGRMFIGFLPERVQVHFYRKLQGYGRYNSYCQDALGFEGLGAGAGAGSGLVSGLVSVLV